jgi:hypothetical protein
MKKALSSFSIMLALLAASPAFARSHKDVRAPAAPYEHIHSGYGPITWDEIEVSRPEGGGF